MKYLLTILLLTGSAFAQNTTYKDGTECNCDSISRLYYESGELLEETPYKNGVIHGTIVSYYGDNKVLMRIEYKNDKRNGMRYINMLSDGYSYTQFINDKAFKELIYYPSGQLKQEIPYGGWLKSGFVKWYFETGKLAGTATYKNGNLVGYKKCSDGRFGDDLLDCLK